MALKWIKIRDRDDSDHRIRADRISAYCGRVNENSQYEIRFALFGIHIPYDILMEDDVEMEKALSTVDEELSTL